MMMRYPSVPRLLAGMALALVSATVASAAAAPAPATSPSTSPTTAPAGPDPLAPWRTGVSVREVAPGAAGHVIHSYFNTSPESPDGKHVLYFASSARNGEAGDVCVLDRATGAVRTLARDLRVEDAHRAACQQWLSNGRRVAFHHERDGAWVVSVADLETGEVKDVARNKLTGWGQPDADVLPLYGPHWDASTLRDLELLDVATGETKTVLRAADLKIDWIDKQFAGRPASIFFPVLSPDRSRVFFKLATPTGTDPRSKTASLRLGLICYDLKAGKVLYHTPRWGHPSWHPDGKHIVETYFTLFDSDTGKSRRTPGLPSPSGDHPSASPDGTLLVTDTTMNRLGGEERQWGVILADARGGQHVLLHQFDNHRGASSWRRSHPHPAFSADGRRIYFNVSSGDWTRLFVAERVE